MLAILAILMTACASPTPAATEPPAAATDAPAATTAPEPTDAPEPTEAAPEPTAPPEPVELHMAWWGSQTRHDRTIAVIEMFMEQHPNITITYEFASFADYWPLLSTKAAAGELPDVIQQDYAYFKQYVQDGLLVPLDPYVADGTIDLSNVDPAAIDGGRVNDELYALSLGTNSQSWAIDVDLFEQAGVPLPEPDWTWADFEAASMAIHESLGIYGNAGGMENPQVVNCMFLSLGEGLYSDDGLSLGFSDPQPLVDYFNSMVRMQDAGAMVSREDQVANQYTLENNPFVTSEAAMYFAHTNQLTGLWTAAGEARNIKLVPVPRAEGATQSANYLKPSMFFSVSAHSEHPVEAAMFIDFFTNSVEANEILAAERGVPISSAVQEALLPTLPAPQVEVFGFLKSLEVSAIRPPDPAKHNELMTNVFTPLVVDAIMYKQVTPEDGVALFVNEATTLLAAQ
jgi:multiple sugar transport system substrate-binding protein